MSTTAAAIQPLPELEKLYAAQDCPVSVISFSRNFGKEAGLYAGLSRAKGDYISLIDADLQQRPELVREMVEILDAKPEFDIVAAYQDKRGDGKVLTFFKENFYRLINQLSTVKLRPDASDFRTFRRKVAESILWPGITGFPGNLRVGGIQHLFYPPTPPVSGRPVPPNGPLRSCSAMPSTASSVFHCSTPGRHLSGPDRRLRASLIYLFVVVLQKLIWGIAVPGYASLIVLILLLGGLQLFCLGLIGEYVGENFEQSKHRPVYLEKTVLLHEEKES